MKKLVFIILVLLAIGVDATTIKPIDQVTAAVRTIFNDGNLGVPDSIRIQVFRNGSELSDAWFNSADAEASAIDNWLIFTDQLQDIDGAGGVGQYLILAQAYDNDSSLYTPFIYNFDVGLFDTLTVLNVAFEAVRDSLQFLITATGFNVGKTGYSLITADWNVGKTGYSLTTADWNVGKTGYSLLGTQTFNVTGNRTGNVTGSVGLVTSGVTVSTNNDKTGYALTPVEHGIQADSTWSIDTTDASAYGATKIGILMDAKISDAGGVASISDNDMASIIDTLMLRALADTSDGSITDKIMTYLARNVGTGGGGGGDATLANQVLMLDSLNKIIDALVSFKDSVENSILDINKSNYKADISALATALNLDSVLTAIADANKGNFKADVSSLALEASLFDPLIDSILLANRAQIAKQNADSVLLYDITGSFPNGSLAKFLRDFGLTIVRSDASQGMSSGTSNHVILDAGASAIDGAYDPSRIMNVISGESTIILEYNGTTKVATLFRDLKTPFNDGDDFIIFSDAGLTETNEGRLRGSTSNTATLNSLASPTDGVYANQTIFISSGKGADEAHKIKSYNGTTKIVILYESWHDQPDDSSGYVILPFGDGFETRFMDSLINNPIPVVAADTTTDGDDFAIKPDSSVYQGAAGSVTDASIAAEVNSVLTTDHGAGSWQTGGSGSGLNTVVVYTIDTSASPDDTLTNIPVAINNLTGSFEAGGTTGSSGNVVVKLNSDDWIGTAGSNIIAYLFDDFPFTVSTNPDTVSILGYAVSFPSGVTQVFGTINGIMFSPDSGAIVTARLLKGGTLHSDGSIISPFQVGDTTDALGLFSFKVIPSPDLLADTSRTGVTVLDSVFYEFKIQKSNGKITRRIVYVPDTGSWELTW